MRYYYKKKDETVWYNLKFPKNPLDNEFTEITEDEWIAHLAEIENEDSQQ